VTGHPPPEDRPTARWVPTGSPGTLDPAGADATVVIGRLTDETVLIPRITEPGPAPAGQPPSATSGMRTAGTGGVVRAGAMMAVATLVSRGTGFLAKIVLLAFLGLWVVNDSYNLANTLPNIIFELLIGGVLTSVAIPLLSRARSDPDGGEAYTQRLMTLAVVALLIATGAAIAAAPLLTRLYQSGSDTADPVLATHLAYLLLPQIFFYGIAALFGAILNTKERFAAPAWAPVVNNLVVIGVGVLLLVLPSPTAPAHGMADLTRTQFLLLGVGTTAGIVLQAAVMLPALWRSGFRFRWRWGLDSRMAEAGRLMAWAIGYALISQIGYIVTARVAFGTRAGFYALYNYGSMLFQLPYGILGVSLLTAIMPRMSRHAAAGEMDSVKHDMAVANRLSTVALLPVTAAMIALAIPLAVVTAKYGKVEPSDARILAFTLAAFAIGLLPLAVTLVQMRVFYAMKDGRTPTLINLAMVVVRIPLLLACRLLPDAWVVPGLALAMSVSYLIGVLVGEVWLRARFGPMGSGRTLAVVGKVALASAAGGVAAWFVVQRLLPDGGPAGLSVGGAVLRLVVGGVIGLAVVGAALLLLRVDEVDALRRRLLRIAGRGAGHGTLVGARQDGPPPARHGQGQVSVTDSGSDRPTPDAAHPAGSAAGDTGAGPGPGGAPTGDAAEQTVRVPPTDATVRVPPPDATERMASRPDAAPHGAAGHPHGLAASAVPAAFAPGSVIGERYRLVSLIATDTAGNRFWRARDTVLPRDMAVTLLPEGPHTPATVARTLRAGRLHHIGLPQTLDVGSADGAAYVVGQWVDGATLTDLLTGGPLDPEVATSVTAKISDAVAEAHRNGIALGAVHPSLVRVNFDGQVRLSHVIAHSGASTDADIRAVGALLYLMLTGTWPLAAADGAPSLTLAATRGGRELPAEEAHPGVPAALSALAERTLHPDDPQGIHAVGAITALLRPPEASPLPARAAAAGSAPPAADPASARVLGPAERKLVRERRVKLSIAGAMLTAFAALIVIVAAAVIKQFMTNIAEPINAADNQQIVAPTTPTTTRTVGTSTAPATQGGTTTTGSSPTTGSGQPSPSTTPSTSSSAPPATKLTIANATVYDPQGTPPKDYESYVDLAYDGDFSTFWRTWVYKQQFGRAQGGLKDGVGLVLNMGKAVTPSSVTVSTGTAGTTVEIRSASSANPALESTQVLGSASLGADPVTITLANPPKSQYLILWITHLAPYQGTNAKNVGQFQSSITEISVTGS
jgi:putative peptidoglycan lipid II flippase